MNVTTGARSGSRSETAGGAIPAVLRIALGLLWVTNAAWKVPPQFGALRRFTEDAVRYPVFAPYSWIVEHVVLANFIPFAWGVLVTEALLGAFLLVGLATRFWAVVGMLQTIVIALSVLNAPNEWEWSYYLMFLAHLAVFATAAGRTAGLDALLRPQWQSSRGRLGRLLEVAS